MCPPRNDSGRNGRGSGRVGALRRKLEVIVVIQRKTIELHLRLQHVGLQLIPLAPRRFERPLGHLMVEALAFERRNALLDAALERRQRNPLIPERLNRRLFA